MDAEAHTEERHAALARRAAGRQRSRRAAVLQRHANPTDVRHDVCSHKAFPQRSRSAFRIRRCGPRGVQPYLELGSFRIKSRTVMAGSGPGLSRAHPAVRLISAARTAYARRGCGRVAVTSLAV